MGGDSEELAAARNVVAKAITDFVRVIARERGTTDDPIVVAWAGYAEYTSIQMEQNDESANIVFVPDSQAAATSRGCFEFGADSFSRVPRYVVSRNEED